VLTDRRDFGAAEGENVACVSWNARAQQERGRAG
jgi:hypothetical protein